MRAALMIAVLAALLGGPAQARILVVGQGAQYPDLVAAGRAAQDGDTIRLTPGEHFDCAILSQRDLVIDGPGAVLTDRTCQGKALLVLQGDNATVRDLVLARARVPDMNGAGIRLEGQGLTLERVRFDNDQVGLLAYQGGPGSIRISDCTFDGGGVAGEQPKSAVMVGEVGSLVIERSTFHGVRGGQVASAADRTELTGNRIETGVQDGAQPAVAVTAGRLIMRDNVLAVGPQAPQRDAAVLMLGTGAELRGNRLENTTGRGQTLLLDWGGSAAVLDGNVVGPGDTQVSSAGYLRHQVGGVARTVYGTARGTAGAAKRAVMGLLGR